MVDILLLSILNRDLFVPNDTHLDNAQNEIMIITGPNMAGKSNIYATIKTPTHIDDTSRLFRLLVKLQFPLWIKFLHV